jgi:aspartyl protease family protein
MPGSFFLTLLKLAAAAAVIPAGHAAFSYGHHDSAPASSQADLAPAIVEVEDAERQIPISDDGLFHVDASLNGQAVDFVVDSGANTTILTQADARRLGFEPGKMHFRQKLVTANGEAPLAMVTITTLTLGGKSYANVRVAIIGNAGGVSLLGQDMIARLHGFSIADGVLTLAA